MSSIPYNSTFDFKSYAADQKAAVEERLEIYLQKNDPQRLWESMRYSVLSGGKRLRALLCIAAAQAVRRQKEVLNLVLPCACAIELVHAMSLIHDDLPALDNDDFRRGKPTNHKIFGEAMALLAGDALLMLAVDILIRETPIEVDRSSLLDVVQELAKASGAHGMVGGQVDDIACTGVAFDAVSGAIDEKLLTSIHRRKTGALIRFSLWAGAKLVGADEHQLIEFGHFGDILGLAFQITDDLLDVTGDISTLGKTPGKDAASDKATWVRLFGVEGSRSRLKELQDEGEGLLERMRLANSSVLNELLQYAIHRIN